MPTSAAAVDICNLALSRAGIDKKISAIDPPDPGSKVAEDCSRYLPVALGAMLNDKSAWSFATKRVRLALSASPSFNFQFAYGLPSDCVQIISVLPEEATFFAESEAFDSYVNDLGQQLIFTDVENATLKYVYRLDDFSRLSDLFVTALSFLLASWLIGSLNKTSAAKQDGVGLTQQFEYWLAKAKAADAAQVNEKNNYVAEWSRRGDSFGGRCA